MNIDVEQTAFKWSHIIGWLIFLSAIAIHTSSCQIYKGEDVEGGKFTQSGLRLDLPGKKLDVNILSSKERTLSPEEHKEEMRRKAEEERLRIELEANEKERLYKIETKEKKRRILLILSLICYCLAVASVVAGILLEGWKVFSTIAIAMMGFGVFFMVLVDMLPVFAAIVMIPVGLGVYRVMYMFKHVAFNKKSEEKAAGI
jgi:hypothetical protein